MLPAPSAPNRRLSTARQAARQRVEAVASPPRLSRAAERSGAEVGPSGRSAFGTTPSRQGGARSASPARDTTVNASPLATASTKALLSSFSLDALPRCARQFLAIFAGQPADFNRGHLGRFYAICAIHKALTSSGDLNRLAAYGRSTSGAWRLTPYLPRPSPAAWASYWATRWPKALTVTLSALPGTPLLVTPCGPEQASVKSTYTICPQQVSAAGNIWPAYRRPLRPPMVQATGSGCPA